MALVGFTQMIDGTPEDFELLHREGQPYIKRLPDRLLGVLNSMRDAFEG